MHAETDQINVREDGIPELPLEYSGGFNFNSEPIKRLEEICVIAIVLERGTGRKGDELRHVYQYWSMDGVLLAEHDLINYPDEINESTAGS